MKAIICLMAMVPVLLSGCGQQGPLYLPDEDAPIYVPKDNPDYDDESTSPPAVVEEAAPAQDNSTELPVYPEQDQ